MKRAKSTNRATPENRARHALPLHILLILLIGGIGVQTLTSCSSGGGDDKDDGGREWVLDGRLVNGYDGNDAWIYLYSDGDEGFVFWDDGDFAVIEWGDGEWDFYFGTWATSGSDLRLYAGSETFTLPYSVSGNQLTIDGDVFIKTSGINLWAGIGGGGSSSSGGGGGSSSSGGGSSVASCTNPSFSNNQLSCGGQSYKTVTIDGTTWMAANLNYNPGTGNSACYGNNSANCTKYGRLYDWETANKVCPTGWHLPSEEEWIALVNFAGGESTAGTKLKSKTGWNAGSGYIAGTDNYDFSAMPGGMKNSSFDGIGSLGLWWTSGERTNSAVSWLIYYDHEDAYWGTNGQPSLLSVRCVKDGGGGSSSSGGGGVDSRLVTGSGEAWTSSDNGDVVVFRSNGEGFIADGSCGAYCLDTRFTWSANGNILTLPDGNYTYSVSGNQLTLQKGGETRVFTKRSGLPLIEYNSSSSGGGSSSSVSLSTAVPDEIRAQFEQSMPLHTGNTPPDISGQYLADNFTLTGSSLSGDVIGREYTDKYVAFIREANGKLSYRSKEGTLLEEGSDDVTVEIVGSNNNFTAYFIATGVSGDINTKTSTVISGTLTSSGISNFHYGFVMLEKSSDPSNQLVPEKTWRTFKDGDGLAVKYDWR